MWIDFILTPPKRLSPIAPPRSTASSSVHSLSDVASLRQGRLEQRQHRGAGLRVLCTAYLRSDCIICLIPKDELGLSCHHRRVIHLMSHRRTYHMVLNF
jgi:hypothetical protein